jgi:hypothetical protein
MGEVLTTTTRAIMHAATGMGKTNFGMAIAGHVGAGRNFLHWRCPCPRQGLYIDGEMSRRLFKDRIADVVRRLNGAPTRTYFFSKEDIEGFAPLNTQAGQQAVWNLIKEVQTRSKRKLDFVVFDSIMSLLLGDMKDEDAWRETQPLILALTKLQIGQLWVHHTGHDTSRGYGTKTREWQVDTVMHLDAVERPDTDVSFTLTFPKARERTPFNRADFEPTKTALVNEQWEGAAANVGKQDLGEGIVLKFLNALRVATGTSMVAKMNMNPTATIEEWRMACVNLGLLEKTTSKRSADALFGKYRIKLIETNWIGCNMETGLAWITLANRNEQ